MFQHTMAEAVGLAYLMFGLIADSSALPSTSKHEVTVSVARCPCGWAWPWRYVDEDGQGSWSRTGAPLGMLLEWCWDVVGMLGYHHQKTMSFAIARAKQDLTRRKFQPTASWMAKNIFDNRIIRFSACCCYFKTLFPHDHAGSFRNLQSVVSSRKIRGVLMISIIVWTQIGSSTNKEVFVTQM